jgi:uncharacterized protein YjaG (DUF416 family)
MTEKCKQYIKSDGLNFCMSSVCPEKDCIYALVNKLHQKIDGLGQENKELRKANEISIEKVTVTSEAKRLQELEQENKELKKQIESQKGLIIRFNCDIIEKYHHEQR